MQRNCTHATNPPKPLPSTSPGTRPAPTVPHAVPQHVSGYETQEKRSRARANTEPHSCNETAPMQRTHLNRSPARPRSCNSALRSQHVSGHETGPNRSPRRAAARGRLRFTRETFPVPCLQRKKSHPRNETAPMQRTLLNRSPARPRARNRPQLFPAQCCSTCAATKRRGNVPCRVLKKGTAPKKRKPQPIRRVKRHKTTMHHGRKTKTKSKIQNLEKRVLSLEYGWEEQRDLSQ